MATVFRRPSRRLRATAVRTGCDLCCGTEYRQLAEAVRDNLLQESELDRAVGADAGGAVPAGDV